MKKHWLYGESHFEVEIDEETDCSKCIHKKVCDGRKSKRCSNFRWGDSRYDDCEGCEHHFTRYDKDSIPCFHCKDFLLGVERTRGS